jgi:glucosamine--fructose-6-phosphate aminotransferase (isomerizing)
MCGIMGVVGSGDALSVVVEGLSRLEYRGYDSAGVAFVGESGELITHKKAGKIDVLKTHLQEVWEVVPTAIGHTRWATHGKVNNENAHPHCGKRIALIHNGIIENASAIREKFENNGETFESETDTEVFLKVLENELKSEKNVLKAIGKSFKQIDGNSAFVILDKETQLVYAVKRSAPLVCGLSQVKGTKFVSSDPYALVGYAEKLFFPENEVICKLSEKIEFFDLDGSPSKGFTEQNQQMNLQTSDKGEFEHFMRKEIHEQPSLIRGLLDYHLSGKGQKELQRIIKSADIQRLHIIGCGTAYHAGLVIKNYFESNNRIYSFVDLASEFRYRNPLLKPKDGGVLISQSGETADTLAAQELFTAAGLQTMAIVNVEGSTLFRNCDYNLLIRAGFEIGVASTKAFTQQVLTGYFLSRAERSDLHDPDLTKEVLLLADRFEELLSREEDIKNIAEQLHNYKGYIFTGRGKYYPIALEGALKLKEIAYVHAEGYASGELKHGPIALIDDKMVNVALVGPELYEKTVSNIEEVKARRGVILSVGPQGDKALADLSDFYIPINFNGLDQLSPLLVNLALQLFSYHLANFKGTDIDKPRNLAKSVTVE